MLEENGFTMGKFRRYKTKIKFLIKSFGVLLAVVIVVYTVNLWKTISKYPVHLTGSNELENNKQSMRHFLKKSKNFQSTNCQIPKLQNRIGNWNNFKEPSCRRVTPVPRSCEIAKSLFVDVPRESCETPQKVEICFLNDNFFQVTCRKNNCKEIHLGIRSSRTSELKWTTVKTREDLQNKINSLLEIDNHGYCYIKCVKDSESLPPFDYTDPSQELVDLENTQLLVLPKKSPKPKNLQNKFININFIFIDSVSRHHFFRSLPNTVNLFEELNKGREAVVLDYELVQAIRSRTFETLNSLLGGHIPQSDRTFGILDMPPEPLKIEGLFQLFKGSGYSTLWQEDLCFLWEWGISKDLLVHNKTLPIEQTWKKLVKAFDKVGIDSFGMTTSNCEILAYNGVNDHFHGPDTVCFNSRHQHEYLLEYLRLYQEVMSRSGQPYFSFLQTNVGHEDTGRRIQTLDADLTNYLKFAVRQENTLTVLFSDHGNTYGQFIDKTPEGRVEIYHPFLFIIIPEKVSQHFGAVKMAALALNQKRLVSHLDLHYTLRSLVTKDSFVPKVNQQYSVTADGLFKNISEIRDCTHTPQIPPNFCICEGGESRVINSSLYVVYAHFAVGVLNNAIQSQYRRTHRMATIGFGGCQRLELKSFQHVRKSVNQNGAVTLTMDLMFKTGDPSYNLNEVFMASVQSDQTNGHMTMNSFDRLSPFSKYSVCADDGVQLKLCICDLNRKTGQDLPLTDFNIPKNDLLMKGEVETLKSSEECLVKINQESENGFTVSLMNICTFVKVQVVLTVEIENVNLSDNKIQQCILRPGELRFLLAGVVVDSKSPWSWSYKLDIIMTVWP